MPVQKETYVADLKSLCRKAAAEGAVLLKNEDGILPLKKQCQSSADARSTIIKAEPVRAVP